jgi:amidohydrolase
MGFVTLVDAELQREIIEWRRFLHAHPELSFEEVETTNFVEKKLNSWGIETQRVLKTGVVGRLGEKSSLGTLGIRADLDALPIQEERTDEFASKNPGVMHACGHDAHTAILLGVARALARRRNELPAEIRLVFQPAEEIVNSGAKALVESGCLDDIDAMIGLHVWAAAGQHRQVPNRDPRRRGAWCLSASDDRFVPGRRAHRMQPTERSEPQHRSARGCGRDRGDD